jgi:hypothetical protein
MVFERQSNRFQPSSQLPPPRAGSRVSLGRGSPLSRGQYRLDESVAAVLEERLADRMVPDIHGAGGGYPVANLYFDTADSELIRRSRAKPAYKEKWRLRAYGVPRSADPVFLEIKKKVGGLVNKRRSAIGLAEAREFIATGRLPTERPYHNRQVLAETKRLLDL